MIPYKFSIPIIVRIADINYGNHVGYQHFFSYFQDARIAYLAQFGFSERDFGGFSMFVAEANCQYKRELLFGDSLLVHCRVSQIKKKSFLMTYQIEREGLICAVGATTNMCFDPHQKKVVQLPEAFIKAIETFEGPAYRQEHRN
jgi:acyl-CoA thioester hydrolase